MSLVQYREDKRVELVFSRWIEDIEPRYWATFTFDGHCLGPDRWKRFRTGKNTELKPEVIKMWSEKTRYIEEAQKALRNHLKRFAIKSKSHLLVLSSGGRQPNGFRPHFHTVIKPDREIDYSLVREELVAPRS